MAPSQSSKILQNALCFLPRAENDKKAAGKPDHGKHNFELPSILNFGRSGRWSGSGRLQHGQVLSQIQNLEAWENGGEQHRQEGQVAPRSSSFSLLDQIQSVSQRFANSINFLHSSSRSEDPHNITTIATEDGKGDGGGDVGDTVQTVAVPSGCKLPAPSALITRRSSDGDGDGRDDLGSPIDPVAVGKKKLPAASALRKLISRLSDEKQQQQFDQVRSSLISSMSPKSSHRFNEADEENLALMLAPVPDPDDDHFHLQIIPQEQQENQSLDFLASEEESNVLQESSSTCKSPRSSGPESTVVQSKRASLNEIIMENNHAPTIDEEKEDANKQVSHRFPLHVYLHPDLHPTRTTKKIREPREDDEIDGGQSFDFWNGTSIKPDSGGTEDEGRRPWNPHPMQATPDLQPKKFGLANHNSTPITVKEDEDAQQNGEGEGGPPVCFDMTTPNPVYASGEEEGKDPWTRATPNPVYGGEEEEGEEPWTHATPNPVYGGGEEETRGSWSPGSRHTMSEGFRTPRSSLDASEIGARLSGDVTPAAKYTPPAYEQVRPPAPGDASATSTVPSPKRKVRFRADGDSDLTASDGASSHPDPSETLLGKLTTSRHHRIRYLQDELEQTRAHVAELELNCEAQKDLKLAFKVQAVRIGAALKKLRDFALESGLDPRGVDPSFVTPSAQPQEVVRQASDTEYKPKEINSSLKLDLLKAEAKQFGWLCDPKEVVLQEYIGSGSSAEIFKAVWHDLDVAVKCVRPNLFGGNTEEAIAGFCQEVEIQSRQRHPYILRMFAACLSPPDRAWIITEYLPSGTLAEWLHGTKSREKNRIVPLPPLSERLRIAMEISLAVEYLHKCSPKVLHRDLKPSNTLLDENNHVRIADFNCARYVTDKDAILTGETGTYLYMAPEVMAHECYDQMCDVYSFSVLLCELVTGNPPYIDANYSPAEIACKVAQGTLRPTLPENQPAALMQLIQSAWEHDPRKRPSFSEITAILNIIAKDSKYAEEPSTDALERNLNN